MQYNTKQREILINFFDNNHDKSFSAEQIADRLKDMDISLSAVYRNLAELENDGRIRKISKVGTRKAYFQFVDCDECKEHLHITCTKCGKTTHLSEGDSKMIVKNVYNNTKFSVDRKDTVLYGLCDKCRK